MCSDAGWSVISRNWVGAQDSADSAYFFSFIVMGEVQPKNKRLKNSFDHSPTHPLVETKKDFSSSKRGIFGRQPPKTSAGKKRRKLK